MKRLDPQSPGLPPSGTRNEHEKRDKHRSKFPARRGRPSVKTTEAIVQTVMAEMADKPAEVIAVEVSQDVGTIRATIKKARASLQSNVDKYVQAHLTATEIAASKGDARPAEWALEHIAEGKDRVVDPPAAAKLPSAPTVNVGIALGGIPARPQLPAHTE